MKKFLLLLAMPLVLFSCHENLEERAARECEEENHKNCPRVMRPEMMMDSVHFDKPTRTMQCFSTLSGSLDTLDSQWGEWLKGNLLEALKNETSNKGYKDAGFNFEYTFYSEKNRKVLFSFTFGKEDYYPNSSR